MSIWDKKYKKIFKAGVMLVEGKIKKGGNRMTDRDIKDVLKLKLVELEEGKIIPETFKYAPQRGYWDRNYDFRTGGGDLSNGGIKSVSSKYFLVYVSHEATGSCPSGPCGWEEKITLAIKPRGVQDILCNRVYKIFFEGKEELFFFETPHKMFEIYPEGYEGWKNTSPQETPLDSWKRGVEDKFLAYMFKNKDKDVCDLETFYK